jgi:uncharacterized protein YjbI with pentapeptide repeats
LSKPPQSPYPPDPEEDAPEPAALADLQDMVVVGRDWANEGAPRLSALRVELRTCRLTGAELAEATLRDVTFHDCRLDLARFRHARLERVVFSECRMAECELQGAALTDVLFDRCELRDATLTNARLQRVEMRGCDLTGLSGGEALRGVRMPWGDVMASAHVLAAVVGVEIVDG